MVCLMRVYIAGRWEARERLARERDLMVAAGAVVVSSWLQEGVEGSAEPDYESARSYALRDLCEIGSADLLIVDTFDDNERGGREVEFGYALGRRKLVWRVGPRRNVFHTMVPNYETWEDVVAVLKGFQR